MTNLDLTWQPWIGKNYSTGGIFRNKLLILGESHYGSSEDEWFTDDLTRQSIQQKIGEAPGHEGRYYRMKFHTNIYRTFNTREESQQNISEFWHSVAFMNVIQRSVGNGPRQRPIKEDWVNSLPIVLQTLQELRPDVVVVLGYNNWDNMWRSLDYEMEEKTSLNGNRNVVRLNQGSRPIMFAIKHPSSSFSSDMFRPFVLKYITERS